MKNKIGNFKPKNRFFLAPMEGINDVAFRTLCKSAGAGLVYSEMTHPLYPYELDIPDKPALQIFTYKTKGIKEFIKKYEKKVSLFDFNLGCPATTARKHGFGSFMEHDLVQIENILNIMREETKKPITIKIRKSKYSFEILKLAEKYCDAICIHPRLRAQGYSGEPDIEFARKLKQKTTLPVIYSGNVNEKNANELLKEFDFVMIGRSAIGNPEIFSKLTKTKFKNNFKDYIKLAKKHKLPFKQIKLQAMNFTKNDKDAKKKRLQIFETRNLDDLERLYN